MNHSASSRDKSKSPGRHLSYRLEDEIGLSPAQAKVTIEILAEHLEAYCSESRLPGEIIHTAVHTQEILDIWRSEETAGRRRAHIAAIIASAAHEQGGIMAIAGLAELLHTTPSTLSKDLRKLAVELHIDAATKGLLEDAGSKLTHKELIVGLDQHGLTGEEISWLTRHAPCSRDRYIETFRRAQTLMQLEGRLPDAEHLARVLDLRLHVAKQYADLLKQHHGDSLEPSENEAA